MIVQERVKKLIDENYPKEDLREYFQIIKENLFRASQHYFRNFTTLIILFIAFILSAFWAKQPINYSFISIQNPEIIKSIFPGLIGYVFYILCCYASMIEHLRVIYDEISDKLFPRIKENNLTDYLKPVYPFYSAEGIVFNNMKMVTLSRSRILTKIIHFINLVIVLLFEFFIVYKNYPNSSEVKPYYLTSSIVGGIAVLFGIFIFLRSRSLIKVKE